MKRLLALPGREPRRRDLVLRWRPGRRTGPAMCWRIDGTPPLPPAENDPREGTERTVLPFPKVPRRPPIEPDGDPEPGNAAETHHRIGDRKGENGL